MRSNLVESPEISINLLEEAFATFNRVSADLGSSYQELEARVADLSAERLHEQAIVDRALDQIRKFTLLPNGMDGRERHVVENPRSKNAIAGSPKPVGRIAGLFDETVDP